MVRLRKMFGDGSAVRLILAFACGLLLGFLASKIGADVQNIVPFLLFPLLVGIASALTIGARNPHPHRTALGSGLLAWIGIGVYLLIATGQTSTRAACTAGSCASTGVLASLLLVYLLVGLVLVALSALVTSAIARYTRRERNPEQRLPY